MKVWQATWSPEGRLHLWALARVSQTTPSRAGQESVKYESAQVLSGDGVLKHSEVDKIEQTRSLPAIDTRSRNEFEKCGLGAEDKSTDFSALKQAVQIEPPLCPCSCPPKVIQDKLEEWEFDSGTPSSLIVALPTSSSGILKSPRLFLDKIANLEEVSLQPWTVPTVMLDPAQAMGFLTGLPQDASQRAHLDHSVIFWEECSKLLLELLTRGMFIPSIRRELDAYYSTWETIILEPRDSERFNRLCEAMPIVCLGFREISQGASSFPSSLFPASLLSSFINTCAESLIKSFLRHSSLIPQNSGVLYSPRQQLCRSWLAHLQGQDSQIVAPHHEIVEFEARLTRWKSCMTKPVSRDPLRLAFNLYAPFVSVDSTELVSATEPWKLVFSVESASNSSISIPVANIWADNLGFLSDTSYSSVEIEEFILGRLAEGATLYRPLQRALQGTFPHTLDISSAEAYQLFISARPILENAGFRVILPSLSSRSKGISLNLSIDPTTSSPKDLSSKGTSTVMGLNTLVKFSWHLSLGDNEISLEQFQSLVSQQAMLVNFKDQWFEISPERAQATLDFLDETGVSGEMSLLEAMRLSVNEQKIAKMFPVSRLSASGWIKELLSSQTFTLERLNQPLAFKGNLRPYQIDGLSWLSLMTEAGIGCCLADDMGLGKTIQLLALLQHRLEQNNIDKQLPTLLFAPMSVVNNWQREAQSFTPNLKIHIHHGPQRLSGNTFISRAQESDLVVTTYSLGYRDELLLSGVKWGMIVLDEAQNIKNLSSKQSISIRNLALSQMMRNAPHQSCQRIALTGTPLENHLEELWSIFDFLNPGLLGTIEEFRSRYVLPIERYRDDEHLQKLSSIVKPFLLRRLKSDPLIISDLPPKLEMDVLIDLTTEQASLYQRTLDLMLEEIDKTEGIHRKGLVLSLITRLKQICNHPAMLLRDHNFSPERSGKMQCLEELIDVIHAEGDKSLIFTQFVQMGNLIKERLQELLGQEVLFLNGELPLMKRVELVDRFQNDKDCRFFILSLKAGGFGINLTAASQVIHFDQWWNPAVHEQATDRAYRIGQKQTVQVRRFLCKGTLEERIAEMLNFKRNLADRIVSQTKSMITEMNTGELRQLLGLSGQSGL